MKLPFLLLSSVLLLSACVSTPKQPITFEQLGQYSAYPLNSHTYRISYQAPKRMPQGQAEEVTLLKSAQTTLRQGFQYFKVLNNAQNQSRAARQAVVYPQSYHYPFYYYHHRSFLDDPFFNRPYIVELESAQVSYDIEMFKEQQQSPDAFDARLILQNLAPKYNAQIDLVP